MNGSLTDEHIDVYESKQGGWWNPEHGEVEVPDGWEFLPRGDAFVTRAVKAAGAYWLAWQPRTRRRPHRRMLGIWAPKAAIDAAQARAAETAEARARAENRTRGSGSGRRTATGPS